MTTIARYCALSERTAATSTLPGLCAAISRHKAKLTPGYATENSRARHNACIAILEAELARREKEGPRLRALPGTYRPFDRVTRPYDGLREFLRADMRAQIRLVK